MYLRIQSILRSNVSLAFFVPHYAAPSKISLSEDFIENHNYQLSFMRKTAQITAYAATNLQSHEYRPVTSVVRNSKLYPAGPLSSCGRKELSLGLLASKAGKISSQLAILSLER